MFRRFIAFAIVVGAFFAAPAFGQGKEKVVLLLNWYTYSEHAPLYLGKERGYFDQEGIDLDIQEGRGSGVTVQAVAARTPTFVYSGIVVQKEFLQSQAELVRRFLRTTTRSMEEACKNPEAAVDAMLKSQPKSGLKETAIVGVKNAIALYHGPDNPKARPLRVGANN